MNREPGVILVRFGRVNQAASWFHSRMLAMKPMVFEIFISGSLDISTKRFHPLRANTQPLAVQYTRVKNAVNLFIML
jgi:hypothetical protein